MRMGQPYVLACKMKSDTFFNVHALDRLFGKEYRFAPMANGETSAEAIVSQILGAFPRIEDRPTPEQIDALMRPFQEISYTTQLQILFLLGEQGESPVFTHVRAWLEARMLLFGSPGEQKMAEHRLRSSPCASVTTYVRLMRGN